jgi:hypothetical protein
MLQFCSMKKTILAASILLFITCAASADLANHGPYLGVEGGMAFPHDISTDPGFAYRGFLGIRPSDYFGIEVGYAQFIDKNRADVHDFDVMARGYLPIILGLHLFAELGGAYVMQDVPGSDADQLLPEAGLGIGYTLLQFITVDASYLHIFGSGEVNSIDFVGVGLTLTF